MTLPRPSLCPMIPSLLIAALLAGCTGLPKVAPAYAVHDFGGPDPVAARSPGVPLRGLEVVAAPWLYQQRARVRRAEADRLRAEWTEWGHPGHCRGRSGSAKVRFPLKTAASGRMKHAPATTAGHPYQERTWPRKKCSNFPAS